MELFPKCHEEGKDGRFGLELGSGCTREVVIKDVLVKTPTGGGEKGGPNLMDLGGPQIVRWHPAAAKAGLAVSPQSQLPVFSQRDGYRHS